MLGTIVHVLVPLNVHVNPEKQILSLCPFYSPRK